MADISTVKNKIATELGTITTNGDIGGYDQLQFDKMAVDLDTGAYPWVILRPPSVESEVLDNVHVLRTYNFGLDVVFKMENLEQNDIENTTEAIMNHFDNLSDDMDGVADGGIRPSATAPQIISDESNRNYAMVTIELQVASSQQLTY